MKSIIFYLLLLSCTVFSCSRSSSGGSTGDSAATSASSQPCTIAALIKDMNGLDGCTFLLQLDNGDKLLPTKITGQDFEFENNQLVEISYQPMPDAMSICMAESQIVEVTCIKLIGMTGGVRPPKPAKKECVKVENPLKTEWMKALEKKLKPQQIDRYAYLDGWAYHFRTKTGMSYIYDCQGTQLCDNQQSCQSYLSHFTDRYTIWVVNN